MQKINLPNIFRFIALICIIIKLHWSLWIICHFLFLKVFITPKYDNVYGVAHKQVPKYGILPSQPSSKPRYPPESSLPVVVSFWRKSETSSSSFCTFPYNNCCIYQIGMFYLFSVFFKIAHLEVFTGMELEEDQQFRMGYAYPISPIEWHTHGKAYFFSFLLHIRKGVEISYWINCVKTTQHSARASSFKAVQGGTSCTILQMAFGGFVSNFWGFFVLKGWNWKRGQL